VPPTLARGAVRSYRTVSPLPPPLALRLEAIGGLFSVALSVASPRLAVSQPAARESSDFPRRRMAPRSSSPLHTGSENRNGVLSFRDGESESLRERTTLRERESPRNLRPTTRGGASDNAAPGSARGNRRHQKFAAAEAAAKSDHASIPRAERGAGLFRAPSRTNVDDSETSVVVDNMGTEGNRSEPARPHTIVVGPNRAAPNPRGWRERSESHTLNCCCFNRLQSMSAGRHQNTFRFFGSENQVSQSSSATRSSPCGKLSSSAMKAPGSMTLTCRR